MALSCTFLGGLMKRLINLAADYDQVLKSILWISFQEDESISAGFLDKTFLVPGFVSEIEIGERVHQGRVDLESKYDKKSITNPHFTFHPPMWVHLHANKEKLFSGVLGVDMIVEADGRMPWIYFVTNPICDLKMHKWGRDGHEPEILKLTVPSDKISLGVRIDFVSKHESTLVGQKYIDSRNIEWHGRVLQISSEILPAQKSIVRWNHQS